MTDLVSEEGGSETTPETPPLPEYTTAFLVVQTLDGQVAVGQQTPLDVLRHPSGADIEMMCRWVADQIAIQRNNAPDTAKSPADAVKDRLRERMANG